jgi:ABC-type uncharacterized transport system permease subunit
VFLALDRPPTVGKGPERQVFHSQILLLLTLAIDIIVTIDVLARVTQHRRTVGRSLMLLVAAAFAAHSASIVSSWVEVGRFPAHGPREVFSFLAWIMLAAFLAIFGATRLSAPAVVIFPAATALVVLASLAPQHEGGVPWILSRYLPAHAVFAFLGFAALVVACAFGLLYVIQERELRAHAPRSFYYLAPSLERCDTLGARSAVVGLVFLTLAILSGCLFSRAVHGRYFSGSPKEWSALIAWIVYMTLVASRRGADWGGRRAALAAIAGFIIVVFVFFWSTFFYGASGMAR